MAEARSRSLLLLAQLPPPVHGVTVMTQRVRDAVAADGQWSIEHLWLGGSRGLQDINRRTLRKYVDFGTLLATLIVRGWRGHRSDAAYLTWAPLTHAALRDGLLAGAAKGMAGRTLVHLHGEGLDEVLAGASIKARLLRRLMAGTELITCTSHAAEAARRSGRFARVSLLPNAVPDPGPPASATAEPSARRPLRIGYLANLDPRKGVLRFVEAIAAARQAGLPVAARLAGPATPFLARDALVEVIHERAVDDILTVEDAKYGAAKDAFFRDLDVLLYPSSHDHAPLVVLEALSYGVVPIVLDTGGVAELLGPGLAGNVLPAGGTDADIASGVTRILAGYAQDAERFRAHRHAARARYLETYTEADFARRCAAILHAPRQAAIEAAGLRHLMT